MRYARSGLRLYAMVMLSVLVAFAPISYLLDPANIGQTMSARILGVAALALAYWAATYRPLDQLRLGLWSALAYAVPSAMVLLEVRLEGSTDHPYLFAPALFWVGLAMLVPLHQTATFAIGLVALSLPVGAMLTGVIDASPRMTGLYVAFAFAITWVAAISSRQRSTLVIQGWRSAESLQQRTEELEAARIEVRQAVDALLKSERRTVMGQLTTGLAGQLLDPLSLLRSRLEDAIGTLEAGSPAHKALSQSLGDLDGATGFLQDITAQTADLARRLEREFDVVAQSRFAARLIERQARGTASPSECGEPPV